MGAHVEKGQNTGEKIQYLVHQGNENKKYFTPKTMIEVRLFNVSVMTL